MSSHEYVTFRVSSSHFADMVYEEEQPIRVVEWKAMTSQQQAEARVDWLFESGAIELSDDVGEASDD